MIPLWADKLKKDGLCAFQASARSGVLYCHREKERGFFWQGKQRYTLLRRFMYRRARKNKQRGEGLEIARPIRIGNNVWIGANVSVLPDVTIGAIIGAGSVVNKDIPANVTAVGNPCRVMRQITEADKDRYPWVDCKGGICK